MSQFAGREKLGTFSLTMDDCIVIGNIIVLNKSCFVWIGVGGDSASCLDNLTTSIPSKFEQMPLSSNLLQSSGSVVNSDLAFCNTMSQKIAKKFQVQSFVSCSVPSDICESYGTNIHKEISDRLSSMLISQTP